MMLHADARVQSCWFSPGPKVVFASADLPAAPGVLGDLLPDVGLLAYHPTDADSGQVRIFDDPSPDALAPLTAVPGGPCVLAALSEAGRGQLEALSRWWAVIGPAQPPEVLDLSAVGEGSPTAAAEQGRQLYRQLLRLTVEDLREDAGRQTDLTGQLCELRRLNDQVYAAMRVMEDVIARLQVPPCHLTHLLLPSGETYRASGPGTVVWRQPLFLDARGFAGLDLCSPSRQGPGQGNLVISLRSRATEAVLASWSFSYEEMARGWFRCSLPRALTEEAIHLECVLTFNTARGTAPDLALADVGPFPELSASADGRPLGQALAHLGWSAVPGSKVGPAVGCMAPPEAEANPGVMTYRLTADDFARIRPTASAAEEYFQPLTDVTGFRLHPLQDGVASAMLSRACFPGTEALVATVQVRCDHAQFPVEYALCLTAAEAGCPSLPKDPGRDPRVLGFSGWQPVPPDGLPHPVTLTLRRPLAVCADLHFATRMAPGQPVWFHWADWLGLIIRLRYSGLKAA